MKLNPSEAERLARELYGIAAAARPLPGEYDDNFHLVAADGAAFVLKVMHPEREPALIDAQCQALAHLALHAPELALPRVAGELAGTALELSLVTARRAPAKETAVDDGAPWDARNAPAAR